jgi:hypothetical protein
MGSRLRAMGTSIVKEDPLMITDLVDSVLPIFW